MHLLVQFAYCSGPGLGAGLGLKGGGRDSGRAGFEAHRADRRAGEGGVGSGPEAISRARVSTWSSGSAPGDTELDCPAAVDWLAEDPHGRRGFPAGQPVGEGKVAAAGMEAYPEEAGDDLGRLGDDAQVCRQHQVHAGTDGVPANGGDGWRLEFAYPNESSVYRGQGLEVLLRHRIGRGGGQQRAMRTGAERRSLGPQHRPRNRGVAVNVVADGKQATAARVNCEGIAPRGRIQRDDSVAVGSM